MLDKTRKRFYKQAAHMAAQDGFAITLDGRGIKTPAGKPLVVPTHGLAQAVAQEWQDQDQQIVPATMPLTQLASTALDRVGPERAAITRQLMEYAQTDLLCYRADLPEDLVKRQQQHWQPVLDWAAQVFDAPLTVTHGLVAIDQPPASLAALERHLTGYDVWRLTVCQSVAAAAGSLVLALALTEGHLDAVRTFDLSALDETFQIERWGEDWEAKDRREQLQADIAAAHRLLGLL